MIPIFLQKDVGKLYTDIYLFWTPEKNSHVDSLCMCVHMYVLCIMYVCICTTLGEKSC